MSLTTTGLMSAPRHAAAADITTTNWWRGDGDVADAAGNQTASLRNGATFAAGKTGQAFRFDGLGSHVNFGNVAGNVGTSDFTLAFWLQTNQTGSYRGIIGKRPACGHGSMFDIRLTSAGGILVELDNWGTNYSAFAGTIPVNDGKFHHVGLVRKGPTASLYIDGRLDASKSTPGITNIISNASLVAGLSSCTGWDGTGYFRGLLDEIVIGPDQDADGHPNVVDNCRDVDNGIQQDTDGDGIGDACDQAPPFLTNLAPADGVSFANSTPTLSATYEDPNTGDDGYVEFEVYKEDSLVASNAAGPHVLVQPGQTATWQVPDGKLHQGGTYTWRARAADGIHHANWTPGGVFSIGGASLDLRQWSSDSSTGRVDYDFSVTASGLNAGGDIAGPCFQLECSWRVETRHANGDVEKGYGVLASGTLASGTASLQQPVAGTHWMEITHIKTVVEPAPCYGCAQARTAYDSGWTKVAEPYEGGDVFLDVHLWQRDVDSEPITFDLSVTGVGASQAQGPCEEKGCQWKVEARHEDGATTELGSGHLASGTWSFERDVSGITTGRITHLKATLDSMCGVNLEYWCWARWETYTTGWKFVGDHIVDGQDLVPYEAALAAALALRPSTFCDVLLAAGGLLPSLDEDTLPDAYERCMEAVHLYGPAIRKVLWFVAGAAGAKTAYDLLIDEHVDEGLIPAEEEEQHPPLPWVPPSDWQDNGCNPGTITITEERRIHINQRHSWKAGQGASEFFDRVNWEWLVQPYSRTVAPVPSTKSPATACQRIVTYPRYVGIDRHTEKPTKVFTVITTRETASLITVHPGPP